MTFKYKLSRRLALLNDRWVILSVTTHAAALAVWAFERPVTGAQAPNSPVVRIVTLPDSVTLNPSDMRQFVAYGRTQAGDSVAVSVVYAATGGNVSATGLYTAGRSSGSYSVIASQSRGTLADTALVSISAVPVASVTVSPAAASLTAGQTVQLAAVTRDSAGNVLTGRTVTWTTTNNGVATVSATGLVAGVATGSATVTAN